MSHSNASGYSLLWIRCSTALVFENVSIAKSSPWFVLKASRFRGRSFTNQTLYFGAIAASVFMLLNPRMQSTTAFAGAHRHVGALLARCAHPTVCVLFAA